MFDVDGGPINDLTFDDENALVGVKEVAEVKPQEVAEVKPKEEEVVTQCVGCELVCTVVIFMYSSRYVGLDTDHIVCGLLTALPFVLAHHARTSPARQPSEEDKLVDELQATLDKLLIRVAKAEESANAMDEEKISDQIDSLGIRVQMVRKTMQHMLE